jgi:predicted nucleic acid-binding protein
MKLHHIPQHQSVLLDANILLYASQRASRQCVRLLERCAQDEVIGILPMHTLAEVMHLLMIAEARDLGLVRGPNPARQLSEQPSRVKSLSRYESAVRDLLSIGLVMEPLVREDFITAMSMQRQFGLLTNDALFAALGSRLRVTSIVSADAVFRDVRGFLLYEPDDLESS